MALTIGNSGIQDNTTFRNDTELQPLYFYLGKSFSREASMTFLSMIFLVSLFGNVAVILVVHRVQNMRKRMNYLLANLSLGSVLLTTLDMPFFAIENFMDSEWTFGEAWCKIIYTLENLLSISCVITVLAITYDRYLGICFPMNIYTRWRATPMKTVIVSIWLLSFGLSIPTIFNAEEIELHSEDLRPINACIMSPRLQWQKIYHVSVSCFFLTVFTLTTFFIGRMTLSLCKTSSNSKITGRYRVIPLLVNVAVTFLLLLLPYRISMILLTCVPKNVMAIVDPKSIQKVIEISRLLMFLNYAVNPVIYNFVSKSFNTALRNMLRGKGVPKELIRMDSLRRCESSSQKDVSSSDRKFSTTSFLN